MREVRNIIRKMLYESILKEGEGIYVKNTPREEKLDGILDMCHYVSHMIATKLWNELDMTQEEQQTASGFMDDFSPDGMDAFEPTGIMNFYCGDWPQRTHEKIIGFIKWILSEKNITVGNVSAEDFEGNGNNGVDHNIRVYRIPVLKNEYEADLPPEMHITSGTWKKLMEEVLGFEDYKGDKSIEELMRRIRIARGTIASKTEIPDQTRKIQKGNIYSTEYGKEHFLKLMESLEELCEWCQQRGYTTVYIA